MCVFFSEAQFWSYLTLGNWHRLDVGPRMIINYLPVIMELCSRISNSLAREFTLVIKIACHCNTILVQKSSADVPLEVNIQARHDHRFIWVSVALKLNQLKF